MTDRELRQVIALCRRRSWDNDVDDTSRIVLEVAYDALRELRYSIKETRERLARQAVHLERAEYHANRRPDDGL